MRIAMMLGILVGLGTASSASANGLAAPFSGPRGYTGSEFFAPVYGNGPYGPAHGHVNKQGWVPGSGPVYIDNMPIVSSLGAKLGRVAPAQGFQAAPWYLYWPYDAHFLTPAPLMGPYSAPPSPYGMPYAPGMPLNGFPGYGVPYVPGR
ncbi:hypothetical protein [Tuwongella immobilis]|uniref:Uncharacterized protein n=1 Tax=Tuwongella immobilis TaxID=692036 RepID=A0A6C2YI20_9BACT|nr:hypothetical protein [Tuwongella immobilis]VIP00911.1 unnamed protein product [Tuwongella immobilis]VTR97240.1 unnamed protein product [Tuwongella immobilis]